MNRVPAVTIELDKALIVGALLLLLGLGWLTGAPIFEPFGRGRLTYLTLLGLPVLLAILVLRRAAGALPSAIRAWWPVIGVLSVYESLKHMHANRITEWLGIRPKDELMLALDERLFGKALPLWMDSWTAPWFQSLMSFFYIWVYYFGPFLLLATVYLMGRSELFRRLRLGLVLGLLGGYVLYILVPVAGPLFLIGDRFRHPIPSHSHVETLVFDTLRFNWDCFPSLHTAIPWILTLLTWRRLPGWVTGFAALLASGVTLSTVALRFHYGIDLIAAFAWVALVLLAVRALGRRDLGRFRLWERRSRRRGDASRSPGRRALEAFGWTLGLAAGAVGVSMVALESWGAAFLTAPVLSSSGVLAGCLLGVALGLVAARRTVTGDDDPLPQALIAVLGLAAWLALLGSRVSALSASAALSWTLSALGARASGGWGALGVALFALPSGFLLGVAMGARVRAGGRAGLRSGLGEILNAPMIGCFAGLLGARLLLFPLAGFGDTVLLAALGSAGAALLLRKAAASQPPTSRRAPRPPLATRPLDARVVATGLLLGAAVTLWIHQFPSAFGEATTAFETVALALVGAAGFLLRTGPSARHAETLASGRVGSALLGAAFVIAMLSAVWIRVPDFLATLAIHVSSGITFERLKLVLSLALLGAGGLAAALALTRLAAEVELAGDSTVVSLCLGGASGSLVLSLVLLPAMGSRFVALLPAAGLAGLAWLDSRRRSGMRVALVGTAGLVALLALLPYPVGSAVVGRHLDPGRTRPAAGTLWLIGEDRVAGFVGILEPEVGAAVPGSVIVGSGLVYGRRPASAERALARLAALLTGGRGRALVAGGLPGAVEALDASGFARIEMVEPSARLLEALERSDPGWTDRVRGVRLVRGSPRGRLASEPPFDVIVAHHEDFQAALRRHQLSSELFELVAARLEPAGVYVLSIRLAAVGPNELVGIAAALRQAFPRVTLRLANDCVVFAAMTGHHGPSGEVDPPLLDERRLDLWIAATGAPVPSERNGLLNLATGNLRLVRDLPALTEAYLRALARSPGPGPSPAGLDPSGGAGPPSTR